MKRLLAKKNYTWQVISVIVAVVLLVVILSIKDCNKKSSESVSAPIATTEAVSK